MEWKYLYSPNWVTCILSATGRRNIKSLIFLQSMQRQSISRPNFTDVRYSVIPLSHIWCCHLSHPLHNNPSCRALTGSLHQMHRSCADMINNGRNQNFDFLQFSSIAAATSSIVNRGDGLETH